MLLMRPLQDCWNTATKILSKLFSLFILLLSLAHNYATCVCPRIDDLFYSFAILSIAHYATCVGPRTNDLFYSFATPQHVLSYASMGLSKAKNPAKVTVLPCTIIKHHLLTHSATMVKHPKQSCVYDIIHHHVVCVRQHQDLWPSMHLIPQSHIPTKHEVLDT